MSPQLHIQYSEDEYKQLKLIALAKCVSISSLARSYIQRGINHDLICVNASSNKIKFQPHALRATLIPPALNSQEQQVQTSVQISPSPEYPKPRSNYELNEWHKRYFSECFLETRMRFFDNPSGTVYDPSLLMAVVSKPRLVNCMLERGKDLKLFRVHGAIVEVIINRMINQKIIANTRGDLLAAPVLLLKGIAKISIRELINGSDNQAASHTSVMISELGINQDKTYETIAKQDIGISNDNSNIKEAGN